MSDHYYHGTGRAQVNAGKRRNKAAAAPAEETA
jgi:hypothetical protein